MAIYLAQIGLSGTQIGMIFAARTITSLLFTLPSGLGNDRFQSKTILQVGLILTIINYLVLAKTQSFPLLLIAFFIGGIGMNMSGISLDSIFYKTTGEKNKLKSVKEYVSTFLLFCGLGVLFSGNILAYIDFPKYLLICCGILTLITFGSIFLQKTGKFTLEIDDYKKDISQPLVLIFMGIIFLFAIHMGAELTSYSPFLKETLHLSLRQIGFYIGTATSLMFIWTKLAAKAIEKGINIKKIVATSLILSTVGFLIMLTPIIWVSFTGRIIHEAGDAGMFVFIYAGVSKFFEQKTIGGLSSLIQLIQATAIFAGSLAFGPLGSKFGHQVPIVISSITTLLALFLLEAYEKQYKKRKESST
ncbi:MAG: MFS transporter [Candidatus Gracilibacteria bacterium]